MASNNETNSQLNSSNDKLISKKHLNEHEETIKSDQMASKKSLSNDGEEQIASMDENALKNLLDEALAYKNPRDVNKKSEVFKRLLQNVTEEEEHKRKFESNSLHWKAQSNSLQNLFDDDSYNQLQNHQSQNSSKKHQQRRKNSTSVSTRRLEGGSLPVDMHHSSAIQSPPDQPFLSELKNNKKRKEKQHAKDTVIDILDIETDRKTFQRCFDPNKDTTSYHDAIEMKPFAKRVEIEHQDQSSSKFTTANSTPNTTTTIASLMSSGNPIPTMMSLKSVAMPSTSSVDAGIQFPSILEKPKSYQQAQTTDTLYAPSTINHNNNIILTGGGSSNYGSSTSGGKLIGGIDQPLQLPSGIGVNSVIDSKSFTYPKYKTAQCRDDVSSLIQTTPSILPTSHSSTTVTNTTTAPVSKDSKAAKKRTAKSERNEKRIYVESLEGFCGNDPIEKLLTFIDGQHNHNNNNNNNGDSKGQKNHPKNGIVSNNNSGNFSNNSNTDKQTSEQLLNADDRKKKMVMKNKEKMNKLKKSNSMDELCSTGRQQEKEKTVTAADSSTANKIVQDVTLRSKNNGNLTSGAKKVENKNDKWQTKRNERRSWGTEGLWPDNTDISKTENNSNNNEDNQENESSSSSSSGVQLDFKTPDSVHLTTNSNFESVNASSEADKFQVVIKKKKVKRKSSENPDAKLSTNTTSNNLQTYVSRRDTNLRTGTKSSITGNSNNNNNNASNESSRIERNPNPNKNSKQISQDAKQNSIGKNRRKSTSSMPPSDEDGEYSDGGDSVQSLPIETTKTTSSLLSAPNINNNNSNNHSSAENSGKMMINKNNKNASVSNPTPQISPSQQISIQQQKPTTFSYADIAKTNTNRTNTNNNNVVPASTEKMWPSISSSSSSSTHQNTTTNSNDPFAISNFDAISNNANNNLNNNNNIAAGNLLSKQQQQQQQQQQHKSTPSLKNTMSFPDLVVESNNNKNKQLSNGPIDIASSNGDATQTEKSFNGLERVFDNNNNPPATAVSSNDRINVINNANNQNQKISYSQSLLENHNQQEMDSNGNNTIAREDNPGIPNATKSILIKSKSVDHNNLSSIEHYPALEKTKQTLSDVLSKPFESLSNKTAKTKQQLQQIKVGTVEMITVKDENGGKKKRDKLALKKSISTVSTANAQFSQIHSINSNNHGARPAVIIMDDCEKSGEAELGITFGFDINEHLLFGHHNGDAMADIDHHSVEMNINNMKNNNNSNCDIMNTNLSSNNINNNISNLTNQSGGFEVYDNFISSPPQSVIDHSQQMTQHQVTIMQSSPKLINSNNNSLIKESTTLLDTSNDLGYMSSSLITNSTTSPANQKISTENQQQQQSNSDNQYENEFGQQTITFSNPSDIKQHMKLDDLISRFVSPEPAKNFNYDELVTFVSEEWTKVERNGVIFNGH